ncbi:unnamed protein product, partial [Brassica rapa subsp. trilocularis]
EADKIKDSARQSKPLGEPKVLIGVVFLFFSLNFFFFLLTDICCLDHLLAFSCD